MSDKAGTEVGGSSPRARGTGSACCKSEGARRFIPASAGNGRTALASAALLSGSSPRARGTGLVDVLPLVQVRFIPASAGNGPAEGSDVPSLPVHPRERGERQLVRCALSLVSGSSPRARGTVKPTPVKPRNGRFIPASAGNGSAVGCLVRRAAVHPRERGERT